MNPRGFLAFAACAALAAQGITATLGGHLKPGMQLIYRSGGIDTPWTIDSVTTGGVIGDRTGCMRLRLRMSPAQATPSTRINCIDGTTMTAWDERSGLHHPARPLITGALVIPRQDGGSVRFEAGDASADTISGTVFRVIPTTVLTMDSTGKAIRRLRERFSVDLATATVGVFEVPDSTVAEGWRVAQQFQLVAIKPLPGN